VLARGRRRWLLPCLFLLIGLSVLQVPASGWVTPRFVGPGSPSAEPGEFPRPTVGGIGTGSGFVVHSSGYVLTNEHVVEGASEVTVEVGGREYEATVVATLDGSDLALVKIDARGLPAVALGNSDTAEIGDEVYALGCPGGVCGTVTTGRIANTGVNVSTDGGSVLRDSLLVDITTAPGSSGGPLVNTRGEVIGIHTAGTAGGFRASIPINKAIPLLQRIPGFSTAQMGRATEEMTFREIREQVGAGSTFVEALLAQEMTLPPGYRWEDDERVTVRTSAHEEMIVGEGVGRGGSRSQAHTVEGRDITVSQRTSVEVAQLTTPQDAHRVYDDIWTWDDLWGRELYRGTHHIEGGHIIRAVHLPDHGRRPSTSLRYRSFTTVGCYIFYYSATASILAPMGNGHNIHADQDHGLYWQRFSLFEQTSRTVFMSYGDFIDWATEAERQFLEHMLGQL